MKRNQQTAKRRQSYSINEYAHDRTVHSLGRGANNARKKQKRQRGLLAAAILVAVLTAGIWLAWPYLPWGVPGESSETTTAGSTSGTNPSTALTTTQASESTAKPTTVESTTAASTSISDEERQARLDSAFAEITDLLESEPGRFGFYYSSLIRAESLEYQADQPFVAASSIKLGINTYLYTKIASGEISPEDLLSYDSRAYPTGDYEAGTGIMQYEKNGTQKTVRETSGLSIRISDNCATNMVIRCLGGIDAINPYLNEISGVVDYRKPVSYTTYAGQAASGKHRTCAVDLGSQAKNLYLLWKSAPETYQPLIDDLCQTEFDFGIQKGIPADVRVAHKIGTNGTYSAENDVGIVFADEPFVLCVMTEMASAERAHEIQAEIAKIIYKYIESLRG